MILSLSTEFSTPQRTKHVTTQQLKLQSILNFPKMMREVYRTHRGVIICDTGYVDTAAAD
eukprot:scaffold71007_cov67-Attheya_sp.AAC.1